MCVFRLKTVVIGFGNKRNHRSIVAAGLCFYKSFCLLSYVFMYLSQSDSLGNMFRFPQK